MKKVLFLSLAVVLLLTQCKKETKIIEPTIKKQVNITFSTGNGSRLSISETGVVSWTNGDKIHIYSNNDGFYFVNIQTILDALYELRTSGPI